MINPLIEKYNMPVKLKQVIFFLAFIALASSCSSTKKFTYLNDIKDSLDHSVALTRTIFGSSIQRNDLLNIKISTLNALDIPLVNTVSSVALQGSQMVPGYLVDNLGNVHLPLIGLVKAEGRTLAQLEDSITLKMDSFVKDPIVQVRFLNFKIVVLGEVNKPGNVQPLTERLTILEAIAESGDLKVTAKRDNVLVVRELNGRRTSGRVDLTSANLFKSPFFYLKENDLVYVDAIKASYIHRDDYSAQYLGLGTGLLSLIISVILLTRK